MDVLCQDGFVQVIFRFDVGKHFRWELTLAVKRPAGSKAQQKEGQGRDDPENNEAVEQAFKEACSHWSKKLGIKSAAGRKFCLRCFDVFLVSFRAASEKSRSLTSVRDDK